MWELCGGESVLRMSCELLIRHLKESLHLFTICSLAFRQYFVFYIRHGVHIWAVLNKLLVNE